MGFEVFEKGQTAKFVTMLTEATGGMNHWKMSGRSTFRIMGSSVVGGERFPSEQKKELKGLSWATPCFPSVSQADQGWPAALCPCGFGRTLSHAGNWLTALRFNFCFLGNWQVTCAFHITIPPSSCQNPWDLYFLLIMWYKRTWQSSQPYHASHWGNLWVSQNFSPCYPEGLFYLSQPGAIFFGWSASLFSSSCVTFLVLFSQWDRLRSKAEWLLWRKGWGLTQPLPACVYNDSSIYDDS